MNLRPVSAYLTRFEEQSARCDPQELTIDPAVVFEAHAEAEEIVDDGRIETAVAEALATERERHEKELADQKARSDELLATERAKWVKEEGARLSAAIDSGMRTALEEARAAISRALAPFIAREILDRLVQEFIETLRTAIGKSENSEIELRGPKDLIDIVEAELVKESVSISRVDTADGEIEARIGLTSVETNIDAWIKKLGDRGKQNG